MRANLRHPASERKPPETQKAPGCAEATRASLMPVADNHETLDAIGELLERHIGGGKPLMPLLALDSACL
jgi:hypothetical protein